MADSKFEKNVLAALEMGSLERAGAWEGRGRDPHLPLEVARSTSAKVDVQHLFGIFYFEVGKKIGLGLHGFFFRCKEGCNLLCTKLFYLLEQ